MPTVGSWLDRKLDALVAWTDLEPERGWENCSVPGRDLRKDIEDMSDLPPKSIHAPSRGPVIGWTYVRDAGYTQPYAENQSGAVLMWETEGGAALAAIEHYGSRDGHWTLVPVCSPGSDLPDPPQVLALIPAQSTLLTS